VHQAKLKPGARVVFEEFHPAWRGARAAIPGRLVRLWTEDGTTVFRIAIDATSTAAIPNATTGSTTAIAIRPSSRGRAARSPRRRPASFNQP
jgi:hypothetical protein